MITAAIATMATVEAARIMWFLSSVTCSWKNLVPSGHLGERPSQA
jgi:hypothetical protein